MSDRIDFLKKIETLEKQLDNAINFIDLCIPFACPYEIDIDDYQPDFPKCDECCSLHGQQRECWKEYFKNETR
ncbi:MAG: hypothetical protein ACLUVC_00075 [Longibaculum sp.]